MMHLIRLYYMCIDILAKKEVITYRAKEHDLLMDIRNGKYLNANHQPIPEFFELVKELHDKTEYAQKNTDLPDFPDYPKIAKLQAEINEQVVRN